MTTIVLGIDGATFDLFEEWLPDLPTISSILDEGISTGLESSVPPVTSPAWRCYATGKDPSKLGVYWWRQLDRDSNEYIGAPDIPLNSKCYWEYLSEWDDEVAVIGVPLNTPPREVNGKLILGGPYANSESYTYPQALQEEIEERFDYKLHPTTDPASADEPTNPDIVADLEDMIHQRFDVAEWMLDDEPELLNITLFYINHLQHMAWKSEGVKRLWEVVDQRLGRLLSGEDYNIIIHSDHGLHEVEDVFYLNAWLESQGYLQVDEPEKGIRETLFETTQNKADDFVNQPRVSPYLPEQIVKMFSGDGEGRIVDASEYEDRINFEKSSAVGLPHGLIYILSEDRKEVSEKLQSDLNDLTVPGTSKKAFESVEPLEEIYSDWDENKSPDLFTKWNDGVEVKDINSEDIQRQFAPPQKFKADNHPTGILLASGPEIKSGDVSEQARLYDLAPTILHLIGHPVPSDVDGEVFHDLFASGSGPAEREIETVSGSTTDDGDHNQTEQVEDRLKELGYLE